MNGGKRRKTQRMRTKLCIFSFLLLALLAPAYADSLVVPDQGFTTWAGEYVSPCSAVIDGVSATIICLDIARNTYIGTTYPYVANYPNDLTTTLHYNGTNGATIAASVAQYNEAAYLSIQLLNTTNVDDRGALAWAIWDIFDPTTVAKDLASGQLTSAQMDAVKAKLTAVPAGFTAPDYVVYTPSDRSSGGPQDFVLVKTPEAPALGLLGLDLSALFGLFLLFRRRLSRS